MPILNPLNPWLKGVNIEDSGPYAKPIRYHDPNEWSTLDYKFTEKGVEIKYIVEISFFHFVCICGYCHDPYL